MLYIITATIAILSTAFAFIGLSEGGIEGTVMFGASIFGFIVAVLTIQSEMQGE